MTGSDSAELLRRAADLHSTFPALDGHVDIPADVTADMLAAGTGASQFDLVKARAGRLAGAVLTIHAPADRAGESAVAAGRAELKTRYDTITQLAAEYPDEAALVASPDEFTAAFAGGRFAIIPGFQNAAPLADGLDELDAWLDRGVSVFAFTFIGNNQWADSARPYPFVQPTFAGGLTDLGKAGVRRLNERGVILDVSQLSSAAFADALAVTTAPVLASHTAIRHFVDTDRNATDAELAALRDNGGLIQVVGFGPYLLRPDDAILRQQEDLWRQYGVEVTGRLSDLMSVNDPVTASWDDEKFWTFLHEFHVILELDKPVATTADLADHIEYAAERVGIDHVGISSDFNHAGGLADWMHTGQTLNVTAELLRRGHTDSDLARLWSGNFLRLWQSVTDHGQRTA